MSAVTLKCEPIIYWVSIIVYRLVKQGDALPSKLTSVHPYLSNESVLPG